MYNVFLASLIASAIISLALALHIWTRRKARGAVPVIGMMLASFVWSCGYIYEELNPGLATQLFSNNIHYPAIVAMPLLYLAFSLQYTGYGNFLSRRNIVLMSVIPAITAILVWTASWHNLMWYNARVEIQGDFSVIIKTYGFWFWVYAVYAYILMLSGSLILIIRLFRPPSLYRSQAAAIIIGALVPVVWNILYVFRILPGPHVDFTPSAFTISGLALVLGVFRFRLLDILPVARDMVIENMNDAIIVIDNAQRLVDFNPAAKRILGSWIATFFGEPVKRLFARYPAILERFGEETEVVTRFFSGEDEAQSYYETRITPISDKQGSVIGHLVAIRNVTRREKLEQTLRMQSSQLNEQNTELRSQRETLVKQQEALVQKTRETETASHAKSEFLASMSHELRTPLSAILGFSELMLDEVPGGINDEQRQCLTDINNSGQHLLNLINDVLDLSRIEAGKIEIRIMDVNLNDVVQSAINNIKPLLDKNEHQVETSIDDTLPPVRADEGRLKQVIMNLLSNANKFTAAGGKIRIEAYRDGAGCRVDVIDNGIGIREEDRERIFEPFTQVDRLSGKEREGSGLGLALCRQFIGIFGGKIWAESEYGKGSKFSFTLPLA